MTTATKKNESTVGKTKLDKDSSDYKAYGERFDKQFCDKIDIEFMENISRRLDNKFQVLVDFTRESEASNCDILLFKNVSHKSHC
jgi:hypothetical protein